MLHSRTINPTRKASKTTGVNKDSTMKPAHETGVIPAVNCAVSPLRFHLSLLPLFIFGASAWSAAAPPQSIAFLTYEEPIFPGSLTMTPVLDGFATVVFTTDGEGRVDDAVILSASHPAFGESVLAAARSWRLNSTHRDEGTNSRAKREIVRYEFQRHGAIISLTHRDSIQVMFSPSMDDARAVRTVTWKKLATPPAHTLSINPKYPASLNAERPAGSVTIDFVIDQTGTVRVPAVVAADRAEFATAALEAVKQWRFAPPLQNGQPVNVEVQRRFRFGQLK